MALSNRTKTVVNVDDVPKTSDDFTALFKWEYGDELYGTQARSTAVSYTHLTLPTN